MSVLIPEHCSRVLPEGVLVFDIIRLGRLAPNPMSLKAKAKTPLSW